MKLLITGVHGFVGSNLVMTLKQENEIYGLDIVTQDKDGVIKTFSWSDLEQRAIPKVDAIIHLAGKAHDTKNKLEADAYFKVNTELTKIVFNYFLKSEVQRFIFFSSIKAAADHTDGLIIDESITPSPVGPYGESKILAEQYIKSCESELSPDKRVYILRPAMIHGHGNKGNLNLLYGVLKKGVPYPLGAFDNRRSFTSIDNLKFIVKGLLVNDVQSGVYNVADDEPVSSNELVKLISETLGKKARLLKIPRPLIRKVAHFCDWAHLPLTTERLEKLTENYVVSNQKIKDALGVEQLPVEAKEGLIMTIKSFLEK